MRCIDDSHECRLEEELETSNAEGHFGKSYNAQRKQSNIGCFFLEL